MTALSQSDAPPYEIIFEDQHLVVLNKSAGLLSQGDISGDVSLVDLMRTYFGRNYVGLVHRLDRNTSGLMVVAKRSKAADRLSEQLRDGRLVRKYQAVLFGKLNGPEHWKDYLLKNEKTNEVKVVGPTTANAKIAELNVSPIKIKIDSDPELTLAEFVLETGRSHQIRAQAAAHKLPLIGDRKYGNANSLALFDRPALHSCYIAFEHPMSKENCVFSAPWPIDALQTLPWLV